MATTLAIWLCVAILMGALLLSRLVKSVIELSRHHLLFKLGKESEEIWLPGDPLPSQADDDDEDF